MAQKIITIIFFISVDIDNYHDKCQIFISFKFKVGMGDILHAICMRISSVKPVPWLALNLHHLFSNGAVFNTQSRSSQTSYAYIDWYITFDMNAILRSLSVIYGSVY